MSCSKRGRGTWKGGRFQTSDGYVRRHIDTIPNEHHDLLEGMLIVGTYVIEHRYVMAVHVGRPLTVSEIVHHVNGVRDDNRLENLQLRTLSTHSQGHKALLRENMILRALIRERLGMTDEEIDKEVKDERLGL